MNIIKDRRKNGKLFSEIAKEVDCSEGRISKLVKILRSKLSITELGSYNL